MQIIINTNYRQYSNENKQLLLLLLLLLFLMSMMIVIIGFTCTPTMMRPFQVYYKVRLILLQSAISITKYDRTVYVD